MNALWWGAAIWAGAAVAAGAQDQPVPPAPPEQEAEEELTPEKAMKLLKEARDLMGTSEELLLDSSRGRALESEKATLERLEKLLRADPSAAGIQGKILEKIRKLLEGARQSQDGTVQKLREIIRKARAASGRSSPGQPRKPEPSPPQSGRPQSEPGAPAPRPYDPNRNSDPVNKFRSRGDRTGRWGDLPARLREAIFSGRRDLDEYPAEFQEAIKEYMKRLAAEEEE